VVVCDTRSLLLHPVEYYAIATVDNEVCVFCHVVPRLSASPENRNIVREEYIVRF
jgi:hypothetical protein